MDHFSKEADFEHALIEALQRYGWEYTGQDRQIHSDQTILSHPTEQDLIDNWAKIIYENNNSIDRLNDCPLTKEEMDELIEQIRRSETPNALHAWIDGGTVAIDRKSVV